MDSLGKCLICPRKCGIDRGKKAGWCGVGYEPVAAKAFLHMWEEPCISGTRGSGTVFFSGCNLKCVYCQNYEISQQYYGKKLTVDDLSRIYLSLQQKGAHNINLVSPSHYIPQVLESLKNAQGLRIPVVYNSNGYESIDSLKHLEGHINVYLPDIKYIDAQQSLKYSNAGDYPETARAAVLEMYRQVGDVELDESGIIKKGLIVRHLILPGAASQSIKILGWIRANLPEGIYVSVMSQYLPCFKAENYPEINRRITRWEYEKVVNHFYKLNFKNGYFQERDSASEDYVPKFNLEGLE
ncbi:MAG: radical SAM protein [Bacillota bacterium]|nr:radical SAM protein [Bacillota bacterium]